METLQRKYQNAIEARQRTDGKIFVQDLRMIIDISRNYFSLRQFAQTYLGDYQKSIFAKIQVASGTLVAMFEHDISTLMEDVSSKIVAYNCYYKKIVQQILLYIAELEKDLQELGQILLMTQQGAEVGRFLKTICTGIRMKSVLAQNNLERFIQRMQNKTILAKDAGTGSCIDLLRYIPSNFVGKRPECKSDIAKLSSDLESIAMILEVSENWTDSFNWENQTELNSQVADVQMVDTHIKSYLRRSDSVTRCLVEYNDILGKTNVWKDKALSMAKEFHDEASLVSSDTFNYHVEIKDIENDENEVEKLISKYGSAKISKLDLLNRFDPDQQQQSSSDLAHVNYFVDRIQAHLTGPLRSRIQKMRKDLQVYYELALKAVNHLEIYFEPNIFYPKASKMKIWRVPLPNFEKPREIHDNAREFWKVWNRDTSMKSFVSADAPKFIAEGLLAFCNPLLHELDKFEQQLQLNKQKLLLSIQKMHVSRGDYKKKQIIDHHFVM